MSYKKEIERKFLVKKNLLPVLPPGNRLAQGYLSFLPVVRVRTEEPPDGQNFAYITIKGSGDIGRDEFEYTIPFEEGVMLLKLAQATIVRKTRYKLPVEGSPELKWELDVFEGENEGLVVVELEMPEEDYNYTAPAWLDQEVTSDGAFSNASLARRPYLKW